MSGRCWLCGMTAAVKLYYYSSGSIRNQQDWFTYAQDMNLASLIDGWFDLSTAGPKQQTSSYERIAEVIETPADQILFLSDHSRELDAAAAAGWKVIGVHRPGEPIIKEHRWDWVSSLAEVNLEWV